MLLATFLSYLRLPPPSLPRHAEWSMAGLVDFPARASLDVDARGVVTLEISETIDLETQTVAGRAQFDADQGEITFPSDKEEEFFERFVETIRLMKREGTE